MRNSLKGLFALALLACVCLGMWMPMGSALADSSALAQPEAKIDCNAHCQSIGCFFGVWWNGHCLCAC